MRKIIVTRQPLQIATLTATAAPTSTGTATLTPSPTATSIPTATPTAPGGGRGIALANRYEVWWAMDWLE